LHLQQPEIDWDTFKNWLKKTHSKRYAEDLHRTAKKYYTVLLDSAEVKRLHELNAPSRRLAMASLSNLAKFLCIHKAWQGIVENAGLKWSSGNSDDLIIERLTKVVNGHEIVDWIKCVKKAVPEYSTFMDFMTATGLRYKEAVNSWNLIIKLSRNNRLDEYYKDYVLEHFRFKELFIRRSKKVFISFVPASLVEEACKSKPLTTNILSKRLMRRGIEQKFGDIREFHASILTKCLRQPEIDFIHGRISSSVFMRNYFNPAWIGDLKQRTLKAAEEVLGRVG